MALNLEKQLLFVSPPAMIRVQMIGSLTLAI